MDVAGMHIVMWMRLLKHTKISGTDNDCNLLLDIHELVTVRFDPILTSLECFLEQQGLFGWKEWGRSDD